MNTPIKPAIHGIIDYAFAAINLVVPRVLGLNKAAVKTYTQLGAGFLGAAAVTDTDVAIKPMISMQTHKTIDTAVLAGQTLLTFTPMIRKDKKALMFHLGFMALAVAHYILTDYESTDKSL